jgi:hypothetical protein
LPAVKTDGGILVGISIEMFDIVKWDILSYCVFVQIKAKKENVLWIVIDVYGSTYEEHKLYFSNKLHNIMACWNGPTLIGGDFNLIREKM